MSIESSGISVLVVGGSGALRLEYAINLARGYGASTADISIITPSSDTNTIAIGQVRKLTGNLSLAPYNSSCKVALLTELQTATIEAQQALLKIIEEPPAHTYIIGTAQTAASILPTIVSRCKTIELTGILPVLGREQTEQYKKELNELLAADINIRLMKAEQVGKEKKAAIAWLQEMTLLVRSFLITAVKGKKPDITTLARLLRKLTAAQHTLQTTNTNVRLTIENLLLEFPKS